MASFWQRWQSPFPHEREKFEREMQLLREKAPIPALWLFGKTGSGKSSLIRYLTGAEEAVVGDGYRPETRTSRRFDFPSTLEPLLSFLDTRGLGEVSYDPKEDIKQFSNSTQLMIVTVRVGDHSLQGLLEPLRSIRQSNPERPVLLVLTYLHPYTGSIDITEGADPFETTAEDVPEPSLRVVAQDSDNDSQPSSDLRETEKYPLQKHNNKDPLDRDAPSSTSRLKHAIPESLRILIAEKERQFAGLYDQMIPVDLTKPEDGFANPNFGGNRIKQAILHWLPKAYRHTFLTLDEAKQPFASWRQKRSRWQVLASSTLAASAGAVPVPWVDIPLVLGIQAHMAYMIADIYEQEITPANWAVLSSAAGSRVAWGMAIREFLKFIPFVGIAVGAASSFAFTYALGTSWDWYFADIRHGKSPSAEQMKSVFAEQLKRGQELWGNQRP